DTRLAELVSTFEPSTDSSLMPPGFGEKHPPHLTTHVPTQKGRYHMTVKITPNDRGNPPGKLAEAELHFADGPLAGLKLIGFAIWERRGGGGRNVTFPARQYAVNGERRSFPLLRPIVDTTTEHRMRYLIHHPFA